MQYYGGWRTSDGAPNTIRIPVEPGAVSVVFLACRETTARVGVRFALAVCAGADAEADAEAEPTQKRRRKPIGRGS